MTKIPIESDDVVIARRNLVLFEDISGRESNLVLSIGRPVAQGGDDDTRCGVWIRNERDGSYTYHAIVGTDDVSALEHAILFIESYLAKITPPGRLCWPDGEPYE